MMSSIITGLFSSQGQSAQIAADLENAGFNYSDYVMYLHEKPIKKRLKLPFGGLFLMIKRSWKMIVWSSV